MQNNSKSSFTILFPLQVLLREHSTSSFISQGLPLLFRLHHLHSGVQPCLGPGEVQIRFEFDSVGSSSEIKAEKEHLNHDIVIEYSFTQYLAKICKKKLGQKH